MTTGKRFGTLSGLIFINLLIANLQFFAPLHRAFRESGDFLWINLGIFVAVILAAKFGGTGLTVAKVIRFFIVISIIAFLANYFFGKPRAGNPTGVIPGTPLIGGSTGSVGVKFTEEPRDHWNGPQKGFVEERTGNTKLADICAAESGNQHWSDSTRGEVHRGINPGKPDDVGLCQINLAHKPKADSLGYNIFTPEGNVDMATWLYNDDVRRGGDGTRDWRFSRCRWQERYDPCPTSGVVTGNLEMSDSVVSVPDSGWSDPVFVGGKEYDLSWSRDAYMGFWVLKNGTEKYYMDPHKENTGIGNNLKSIAICCSDDGKGFEAKVRRIRRSQ